MIDLKSGWSLGVERGPNLLFVTPRFLGDADRVDGELADELWSLLQQHFVNRLVLEMHEAPALSPELVEQLQRLQDLLTTHGGLLRVCGLDADSQVVLRERNIDGCYGNREDAVMSGHRPSQPR